MSSYPGRDLETMAALEGYTRLILDSLGGAPSGAVCEVGAGIGNLSVQLLPPASRVTLLEPDDALFARLNERLGRASKARLLHGTLEEAIAAGEVKPASFDACVLVNVLEHVQEDLSLLRAIGSCLRQGGRLLLFVPAFPALFGSLDEAVGHLRRYRRAPLARLLAEAGFVVDRLGYVDLLGMLPWFVAGRVLRRPGLDPAAARLYEQIGVPLTRALERRLRVPFGKNLACVARWP